MNIQPADQLVPYLSDLLEEHLGHGERVVWLIPGGSGIVAATKIAKRLSDGGADLTKLSVTLTDERFGAVGHEDENWQQLLDAGFSLPGARTYRILNGASLDDTAEAFADTLDDWLHHADYTIGMFGIGTDGHIAGIKPHSPAISCEDWTCGYKWDDYTRITATTHAIIELDEAVAYAVGSEKSEVLHDLLEEDLPIDDQPAQILKQVTSSTVFTDYNKA